MSDDWIPYGDVKLALDARDNAWVAFEDRRGDEDLIQVAMIAPDGKHTLTQAWPGTAPDVAAEGETAIVAWGTQGQGDQETGGGIGTRVLSPPGVPMSPLRLAHAWRPMIARVGRNRLFRFRRMGDG